MFKKKYRFRALSSKPTDKPKGFTGLYDHDDGIEVMSSKDGGAEVLMNGDIGGGVVDSVDDMRQLDLHASDSRAGRSAHLEEDDERQQALEAIKSSRNAEKKFVTSRFSNFPRVDIFLQSSEVFSKVSLVSLLGNKFSGGRSRNLKATSSFRSFKFSSSSNLKRVANKLD
ncbi:hypothetical protein ACH5RR_012662 [Cinchona calisaya]|uniref:Uncharacterized protein n=1 Tax=Cinchona calisaya TaxID=153742 RepID=A0ABD3A8C1_9GENT